MQARSQALVDLVNSPAHYKHGRVEVIEVIEDSLEGAQDIVVGYHVGQVLKYLLRAWHKGNPLQDLRKARWYLDRAIKRMENAADQGDKNPLG